LIHPVCWDLALTKEGKPNLPYLSSVAESQQKPVAQVEREFMELLQWEREVNQQQKRYIDGMGKDEAMIVYPIGRRQAMLELEEHCKQRLGERCVIVRSESPQMNRKVDFREILPDAVRLQIADDLMEAIQRNGEDPKFDLEMITYNRIIAYEIEQEFAKRGLRFDPKTVEAVAFGEGFAACAMNWKAMVPYYLGMSNPIENDFLLSVDGPIQLRFATFKERIALDEDVRLFLWTLKDGRPLALFGRARARFSDPQLHVELPFKDDQIRLLRQSGKEELIAPGDDGKMRVPVYAALRRTGDFPAYIVGQDMTLSEFRQGLVAAFASSRSE
jgi:hypothetical protein